ncbi:MAG TPA: hypothetical protein VK797_22900 [Tepidisphaeraceae bacterium]|jgi:hypothetical protein|nr:hypothetical protein [Tepidisphaeraceae bacterium]
MSDEVHVLIKIPRELFLDLVWLQAHYAAQLNTYDGGRRGPVDLGVAEQALCDRERKTRDQLRKSLR